MILTEKRWAGRRLELGVSQTVMKLFHTSIANSFKATVNSDWHIQKVGWKCKDYVKVVLLFEAQSYLNQFALKIGGCNGSRPFNWAA